MRKLILSVALLVFSGMAATAQSLSFSKEHGFCDKPFELKIGEGISLPADGTAIRYTLDGSVPTAESAAYTGPITISGI